MQQQGHVQRPRSAADPGVADEKRVATRGHWVLSLAFVVAAAVGFWLFSSGFLLTRSVLPDHSAASVLPFAPVEESKTDSSKAGAHSNAAKNDTAAHGSACGWYPAKFDRAVVLVIDALRVDFATWSDELGTPDSLQNASSGAKQQQQQQQHQADIRPKPYHNRMPIIDALNKRFPDQTMLYRFRADPPTTTLQRLKGLTTGQLPTFIDAGSNFAGSAISEDNWLQALRRPSSNTCSGARTGETEVNEPGAGKTGSNTGSEAGSDQLGFGSRRNLVFLGDDTWMSLFPDELSDTHAIEANDTLWKGFLEEDRMRESNTGSSTDSDSVPGAAGPRGWARVRPFPSLNVWDLDTVDDGVLSRLPMFLLPPAPADGADENPEIGAERRMWRGLVRQPAMLAHADFDAAGSPGSAMVSKNVGAEQLHRDWDMIVAHGLGVDHCGHRFGPDHPAISQKLDQMNRAIELIVQAINRSYKRTALFVFGDHGMDPKGDHGGDSPREVDAALWVYSNTRWRSSERSERVARVLETAEAVLDNVSPGASVDGDLRSGWWRNTHLSDEYRDGDGVSKIAAPRLRSVPQIDLVPTLSLALGLHVPFNNLGAAIPEFFAGDDVGPDAEWGLLAAVRVNAAQTMRYLETYMKSTKSHGFSDEAVLAWRDMYARAETSYHELRALTAHSGGARGQPEVMRFEESVAAQYYVFMRVVLGTLRQMWAQFDAVLIVAGLLVLAALLAALVAVVVALGHETPDQIVARTWGTSVGGGVAGAVAARSLGLLLSRNAATHASQHQALATGFVLGLVCAFVAAVVSGLVSRRGSSASSASSASIEANPKTRNTVWALNGVAALTAVVHGLAFSSNSFTFREDSIVLYLAQTLAVALVLASVKSMRASATEQQRAGAVRALACAAAVLALNRVSSYSTVCREEQLPGCTPTFYGLPSASISSIPLAAANAAMVWLVPLVVRRFLRRSRSDQALISKLWVSVGMRVSMGMAALYWVLDSVDGSLASDLAGGGSGASSAGGMETAAAGISTGPAAGSDWSDLRIVLARMAVGVALGGGLAAWFASPFCIDVAIAGPGAAPGKPSEVLPTSLQPQSSSKSHIKRTDNGNGSGHQTTAVILGYGNAYGAAYLVFVSVVFCVLYVFQQPMGGIMLSLLFVELVVCAELFDSLRDALGMADGTPLLPAQMALTAQLAYLGFFATGHQFTLVSIQWSTAFVGVREMQLLVCGAIVVVNTFGAFILCAASVPLAGLWNESLGSQALRLAPNSFFSRLSAAGALFAAYNLLVSASAAAFAAWFRRHLMVWKIFAPRFMFSAPTMLLSSALILFVAVGFAAARILRAGLAIGSVQAVVARRLRGGV